MNSQQPAARRRRWFSFSLRGLFLIVTIGCVWLAVVTARARKQAAAIAKVAELKGNLRFAYQVDDRGNAPKDDRSAAPLWLRQAIGEDYFRRVVSVSFASGGGNKVSDDDLAVIRSFGDLRTLELNNNPRVTDAGLVHLAGLNKLRVMHLYRANVKGPGIRHLPRNLEWLTLTRTPLEDEGLVAMKRMTKLKTLRLEFTNVTDAGLANVAELSELEDLRLRNTEVTDAGLEQLRSLKKLKYLSLDHTKVTGAGIARLQKALPNCGISPEPTWLDATPQHVELWPENYRPSTDEIVAKIKELDGSTRVEADLTRPDQPIVSFMLHDSKISDESLVRLLAEMPQLEKLNLRRVLAGDEVAKKLSQLSKLCFLQFEESRISDDGLAEIARIHSLKELSLNGTKITDAGLMHLTSLTNLRDLLVQNCEWSDEGLANLKRALPKCRVSR